jgi:molecular chaperone HtpG
LERKFEKARFTRVDSDTVENLIVKEEQKMSILAENKREVLTGIFESQLPQMEKREFHVMTQAMGETAAPVMITQAEYMRRMKDMAAIQGGMSFYGDMPDMYTLLLNEEHPLIKRVLENAETACADKLQPIDEKKATLESRRKELYDARTGKKEDEVSQSEKDELFEVEKEITAAKSEKEGILAEYAAGDNTVKQLIDITLLQNNMLTGEALNNFVKRSIELMK